MKLNIDSSHFIDSTADNPREAARVFEDANVNNEGKYTTDPPIHVDSPAPRTSKNAKVSVETVITGIYTTKSNTVI